MIQPPMPMVIGAPRSGTTLLRFMLDAHPDLAIPPETGFLAVAHGAAEAADPRRALFDTVTTFPPDAPVWPDFHLPRETLATAFDAIEPFDVADGLRAFYRLYAARFGKVRWGDKTPLYCQHVDTIARLLPEAHFIHVIRDGRDVALSLREMWFAPGRDIETLAAHWKQCVLDARAQAARSGACYREVRFESLVRDPAPVLAELCEFLQLRVDPAMLAYHERVPARLAEHRARRDSSGRVLVTQDDRVRQQALTMQPPQPARAGAWTRRMSDDERQRFAAVAGDMLIELGYGDTSNPFMSESIRA